MRIDGPWEAAEPDQPGKPEQPRRPVTSRDEPPTDEPDSDGAKKDFYKPEIDQKGPKPDSVEPPTDEPNIAVPDIAQYSRRAKEILVDRGYSATPQAGDALPVTHDGTPGNVFNKDLADQVPPWGIDLTTKTSGILDLGNGETKSIVSGRDNTVNTLLSELPEGALKGTGFDWNLRSHVEAQAAVQMRLNAVADATLYINREMCSSGRSGGCAEQIGNYLADGQRLTLYGPDGGVVIEGHGPRIPGVDK